MTMAADQTRRSAAGSRGWRGAPVLSCGFRPFFLAAGSPGADRHGLAGDITIPTAFSAVDWHAHVVIFGYVGAVIAGFLPTAIPNWTGRLPVAGWPLAALAALWAVGRMWSSDPRGSAVPPRPSRTQLSSQSSLRSSREVIAGRNWRNLKVAALVPTLALVNVAFHVEDARSGVADTSHAGGARPHRHADPPNRRARDAELHRQLAGQGRGEERPAPFGRADGAVLGLSGLLLAFSLNGSRPRSNNDERSCNSAPASARSARRPPTPPSTRRMLGAPTDARGGSTHCSNQGRSS